MLPLRAASRAPVALALSLAALGCGARTTLDDGGGPSSAACTPPPPKVDVNGVWAIALGQATADDATFGVDVATDDAGGVVVAAALADVDLGCPLTPRSGPGDLVIVKLDERDGSVAWTHAIGGPGFEADQVHVGLDARGRVYALATNHQGTPLTLEDGTVVAAPFVVALDQDGALRFAREVPEGPAITYVGGAPFVFSVAADGTFALAGGVVGDALVNGVSLPGGPGPESAAFVAVFGDDGAPVTAFEIEERDVPPLARIDALHFLPGGDLLVGGERFGVDGQPSSLYRTSAAGRLRWSTGVNASVLAVRTDDVLLKENGPDPFARVDLGSGVPSVFAASIIHPEQPPSFRAAAAQGDGPAFFAGQWPPRDKPSEDVLAAVGAPTQLTDTFGCTAWNTFTGVAVAASGAPVVVGYLEGDAQLGVGVTLDPTCTGLRCATIFVSRIPF
ncbi:MAG TPA: hypothetical protein VGM56_07835 [Byssovorax sp.]|jgi:hypothetical protein